MTNAVIVGDARYSFPIAGKGALIRVHPDDLAARLMRGLLEPTGVEPSAIGGRQRTATTRERG